MPQTAWRNWQSEKPRPNTRPEKDWEEAAAIGGGVRRASHRPPSGCERRASSSRRRREDARRHLCGTPRENRSHLVPDKQRCAQRHENTKTCRRSVGQSFHTIFSRQALEHEGRGASGRRTGTAGSSATSSSGGRRHRAVKASRKEAGHSQTGCGTLRCN